MPTTNDQAFESQFADLAFAAIKDKAPSLFDYLVGFQVLDANEEQTHAVGVYGCHVGNDWVYLPVFFLQGELKSGLMYLRGQDLFVPLTEAWVSHVLNRKPYVLGETADMNRRDMTKSPTDFSSFIYTPTQFGKTASARSIPGWGQKNVQPWAEPFVKAAERKVGDKLNNYKLAAQRLDLGNFVRTEGPYVAGMLAREMARHEKLAMAVTSLYPIDQILLRNYDFAALTNSQQTEKQASERYAVAEGPAVKVRMHYAGQPPRDGTNSHDVLNDAVSDIFGRPGDKRWEKDAHSQAANYRSNWQGRYVKTANDKAEACEHKQPKPELDKDQLPWRKDRKNNAPEVEVITQGDIDTPGISAGLSDKEKEDLMKGEIVIRDHRTNTSKVYRAEVAKTLGTVDSTGIYQMLSKGGEFTDILVIQAPKTIGSGHANCVTAVELKGKIAVNAPPAALTVMPNLTSPFDWMRFFKEQTSVDNLKPGQEYVIVTVGREGTIPFQVLHRRKNLDGTIEYWVKDHRDIPYDMTRNLPKKGRYRYEIKYREDRGYAPSYPTSDHGKDCSCHTCESSNWWAEGRHIVVTPRPGGLTNVGDTLFVPSDAKAMQAKYDSYKDRFPESGTAADAEAFILGTNQFATLKVFSHGAGEYSVTDSEKTASAVGCADCLKILCHDHGISGRDAIALVKEAQAKQMVRVLIKKAYDDLQPGPVAPAIPEQGFSADFGGYPTTAPMDQLLQVPDLAAQQGTRQLYNPNTRLDQNRYEQGGGDPYTLAAQAAGSNQKDVFDAGVIGSLLNVVDSDALVDKYTSDMMLTLDRLGRTLFLYYQHPDAFRERYGDDDMPELEDALKSQFDGLGDLVLKLKQDVLQPSPQEEKTDIDLTPVAN